MTNLFTDIPLREGDQAVFNAVIEIPKNAKVKYEYNEKHGVIMVDRVLKVPHGYPQNYGFFPQTWNKHDNDPMDLVVFSNESLVPGAVVPVRVIGIVEMDDTGELDHKILTVMADEATFVNVGDVKDLPENLREELVWFLTHYKELEKNKYVKIIGVKGRKEAETFLKECESEYQQNHQ